jgi:tetratricopeptide (TPR) repeat protein
MSDAEILKKANGIFEDANEMALKRPDAAIPMYLQAAMEYRYLVEKRGVDTAALHKNAGNAFLLAGDIGRAVLEYERAKALDPSDPDNNDNLRYAKSLAMDDTGETLPAIVASRVFFWHFWPYDIRFALFAVAWTALWILAGVLSFNAKRPVRWAFAAALVLSLMFGLSALATELRAFDSVDAVVVAKKAIARKGNSDIYAEAFTSPLHAGTECSIIERRGKWFHVELPAGQRCWLPENVLELVDR